MSEDAHTLLELRYFRLVERAHGLPRGHHQYRTAASGVTRYEDVRYDLYGVVVELDGRIAHPDDQRWRDMRRDNATVKAGGAPLRYGWRDVTDTPCAIAAEIAEILTLPQLARPTPSLLTRLRTIHSGS